MSRSERHVAVRTDYPTAAHETPGDRQRLYDLHTTQNAAENSPFLDTLERRVLLAVFALRPVPPIAIREPKKMDKHRVAQQPSG